MEWCPSGTHISYSPLSSLFIPRLFHHTFINLSHSQTISSGVSYRQFSSRKKRIFRGTDFVVSWAHGFATADCGRRASKLTQIPSVLFCLRAACGDTTKGNSIWHQTHPDRRFSQGRPCDERCRGYPRKATSISALGTHEEVEERRKRWKHRTFS